MHVHAALLLMGFGWVCSGASGGEEGRIWTPLPVSTGRGSVPQNRCIWVHLGADPQANSPERWRSKVRRAIVTVRVNCDKVRPDFLRHDESSPRNTALGWLLKVALATGRVVPQFCTAARPPGTAVVAVMGDLSVRCASLQLDLE